VGIMHDMDDNCIIINLQFLLTSPIRLKLLNGDGREDTGASILMWQGQRWHCLCIDKKTDF
jgi:hypothetical protein